MDHLNRWSDKHWWVDSMVFDSLRLGICSKYFLSFRQKNQRKLRQTKCLLFNFWVIKTPILPNCQMPNGFLWYRYLTINLVIQKWRSKHFVFSQFSLATCFFREWEKIFYTYFRPRTTDAQWGNHLNCMHGRKSNPNPKFIGTTEAYFVCHTGPKLQVS